MCLRNIRIAFSQNVKNIFNIVFSFDEKEKMYNILDFKKLILKKLVIVTFIIFPIIALIIPYLFGRMIFLKFAVISFILLTFALIYCCKLERYFLSALFYFFAILILCVGIVVQGEHLLYIWFAVIPSTVFLIFPTFDALMAILTFSTVIFLAVVDFHKYIFSELFYYNINIFAFFLSAILWSFFINKILENLFFQLKEKYYKDALTNAFNRYFFNEFVVKELSNAERYGYPVSFIMVDIDDFKKVNDTYGHDVGDKVLKTFAEILSNNIRKGDFLFRWGGEEFLIIAPHLSVEKASKLALKLKKCIENTNIIDGFKITASFGVAEFGDGKSVDYVLKIADEALYKVKRSGKNGVAVAYAENKIELIKD